MPAMSDSNAPRPDSPLVDKLYPSPNHGERKGVERPDCIILHYTGMSDAASALLWLCNPIAEVSCHYFVFEDGRIWQLVPESRRAWHAGKSSWQGETDMNSRSIGIEIVNPGHDLTVVLEEGKPNPLPPPGPPFPEEQIAAVSALVKDIAARRRIEPQRILAHSDIAPGRKIDPGEWFPWERLAQDGVGLWHAHSVTPHRQDGPAYRLGDEGMPVAALQALLARFGYGIEITGVYDQRTFDVVVAFQRHWRQGCVDGVADGETMGMLRVLLNIISTS